MSAADNIHKPADALAELLAEEATSKWLPSTAGPSAAALPLSELADTADLPRDSMAATRRRRWRHNTETTSSPTELAGEPVDEAIAVDPPAVLTDDDDHVASVLLAEAADLTPAPEPSASPARRSTEELPVVLPRGPRPRSAAASACEAPVIELARGPRPVVRTPAAATASLSVVPLDDQTPSPAGAIAPALVDPMRQLLEELEDHEDLELEDELELDAAAASQSDGGEAARRRAPRVGRRTALAALAAGAVAASAAALPLTAPTAPPPRLRPIALPDAAAVAVSTIERQIAREERSAQLAKTRAAERRAAERRRAARKRAAERRHTARRLAVSRRAAAPAPVVASNPSVPARAVSAPQISRPITRQPTQPTCHTDLGPC